MKKYGLGLFICIFLIFCFCSCSSPYPKTEYEQFTAEAEDYFRSFFAENAAYSKKTISFEDGPSEGGEVNAYYKNGTLTRLTLSAFGSMGKTETDYFIIDSDRIYSVSLNCEYDPENTNSLRIKEEKTEEYFFLKTR